MGIPNHGNLIPINGNMPNIRMKFTLMGTHSYTQ